MGRAGVRDMSVLGEPPVDRTPIQTYVMEYNEEMIREAINRELSRGHLGLYNVDTILIKYYGEGFGLYLENRTDGPGAVVTATLPIRREEKAQC